MGRWPPTACGYRRITACGVAHARTGDRRKPFKRQLRLTSGPWRFSEIFKIFHLLNFEIQNSNLSDVQNLPNFA
jgi:hypothetical protein